MASALNGAMRFQCGDGRGILPAMSNSHTHEILALLTFYQEAGADALLEEVPVNRLTESSAPARKTAISAAVTGPPPSPQRERAEPARGALQQARQDKPRTSFAPPPSPEAAEMAAREAAKGAASLEELRAILDRFEGCALRAMATQLVFADGNPRARVMFVGEAPGRDEDLAGLPFVGRSGKLLDRMMAAIGLDRSSAYIANIVPWRPPGNRTPTPQESAICFPFLLRQIELVDPDILVCLGAPSAQTLLKVREGIMKTRGRWFAYQAGKREIRAIATLHPAYLLRSPAAKRLAWRDFLEIKNALAETATK
jgi:uracil-DNA glycosylase family 4